MGEKLPPLTVSVVDLAKKHSKVIWHHCKLTPKGPSFSLQEALERMILEGQALVLYQEKEHGEGE